MQVVIQGADLSGASRVSFGTGLADFVVISANQLVAVVPPLLLIFAVLGSIFFGIATPTEAAGVGVAAAPARASVGR